jgi:hypothetical protein
LAPFGFARIIDIGDETNPEIIARLMLEVHDPANGIQWAQERRGRPNGLVMVDVSDYHFELDAPPVSRCKRRASSRSANGRLESNAAFNSFRARSRFFSRA